MPFKQPGPWLFALGMLGLGVAALALAWTPSPPRAPGVWMIPPVCLILSAAGLLVRRTGTVSGAALFIYWAAWLVFLHVPGLLAEPGAVDLWVQAAQVVVFAAVAGALARPQLWLAARGALGATVLLFGVVHVSIPEAIAGLLPGWFPVPGVWPYLTGAVQIVAGAMILLGFRVAIASFVVGLMWVGWIPFVQLPRLIDAPEALFQWTFMLTTLAMAGAAWSVGERIASQSGEDLQRSAY